MWSTFSSSRSHFSDLDQIIKKIRVRKANSGRSIVSGDFSPDWRGSQNEHPRGVLQKLTAVIGNSSSDDVRVTRIQLPQVFEHKLQALGPLVLFFGSTARIRGTELYEDFVICGLESA